MDRVNSASGNGRGRVALSARSWTSRSRKVIPPQPPKDRERDWQSLMEIVDNVAKGYRESHGANGYALFNTLTDLASRPPDPEGEPAGNGARSTSRSYGESGRKGYTFIRRERHTLQARAGTWLRWFLGQSASRQLFETYLSEPCYPTSADLRLLGRRGF